MVQLFKTAHARVARRGVAATMGALAVFVTSMTSGASAQEADFPAKVEAAYRISFNGFDIGTFDFRSHVGPRGYALDGNAQISALLGVVNWQGITRSTGRVAAAAPDPDSYLFNFRSNGKGGMIRLGFEGDKVAAVSQVPPLPTKPGEIPVKKAHLKGVLDPLSAVMALTKPKSKNPCDQRLEVFDGKQRFDLQLSYKKQEAIGDQLIPGQPSIAIVCRVHYHPISGFTPTSETHRLSQGDALEVALRPVPQAGLYIPHEIRISTMAGPVRLTAQRVHITTDNRERIALVSR